jgi:hypothetical protein
MVFNCSNAWWIYVSSMLEKTKSQQEEEQVSLLAGIKTPAYGALSSWAEASC